MTSGQREEDLSHDNLCTLPGCARSSFGAAIFSVDETTQLSTLVDKTEIPGQKATCWATVSLNSNSTFVTDPTIKHFVEISLADASILSITNFTYTNDATGYVDLAVSRSFAYALAPGSKNGTDAEIAVLPVAAGRTGLAQSFNVGSWAGASAQGLSIF